MNSGGKRDARYRSLFDECRGWREEGKFLVLGECGTFLLDLIEGAQTLNVVLAGPVACEGRWGTALGASGGFLRGIPSLFASFVILRPRGAAGLGD